MPPHALILTVQLLLIVWPGLGASAKADDPAESEKIEVEVSGIDDELLKNVRAFLSIDDLDKRGLLPKLPLLGDGDRKETVVTSRLIESLHKRAPGEIRQALRPFGYYEPKIDTSLIKQDDRWVARYEIDPGPPTLLQRVEIRVEGEGSRDAEISAVLESIELEQGQRVIHSQYEEAKAALNRTAFNAGYLDARYARSELRVEPNKRRAEIYLILETGPRYFFGPISIEQDILDPAFVQRFVTLKEGEPFSTERLLQLQTALSDSDYFASVEIQPQRERTQAFRVPVIVKAEPRKPRVYAAGVGFATDTGPRTTLGARFRRINRRGHQIVTDAQLSFIKQGWAGQYQIPLRKVPKDRFIIRTSAEREDVADVEATRYLAGLSHNTGWLGAQRRVYLDYSFEDFNIGEDEDQVRYLMPGVNLSRQHADDLLYPRKGYSWEFDVRGAEETLLSDTSFVRSLVALRTVFPLGPKGRLLLRGEGGAMSVNEFAKLPTSERFYAGGDQSVRGYDYQTLGPTDDSGDNVGGRYLLVGSVETEYLFIGKFGAALFFDAGNADDDLIPDLKRGTGLGLRWRSPIGMARLDFAWPLDEDADFRIHVSFGPSL